MPCKPDAYRCNIAYSSDLRTMCAVLQPVLVLANEQAVAEVLQLSGWPVPGVSRSYKTCDTCCFCFCSRTCLAHMYKLMHQALLCQLKLVGPAKPHFDFDVHAVGRPPTDVFVCKPCIPSFVPQILTGC